ncbi:MAG: hypothetical protein ACR2IK_21555 [Chloroflexota bacterium]
MHPEQTYKVFESKRALQVSGATELGGERAVIAIRHGHDGAFWPVLPPVTDRLNSVRQILFQFHDEQSDVVGVARHVHSQRAIRQNSRRLAGHVLHHVAQHQADSLAAVHHEDTAPRLGLPRPSVCFSVGDFAQRA